VSRISTTTTSGVFVDTDSFNSIIVASLGFTNKQTTLLNMPTGQFKRDLIATHLSAK
jgi:hypothetical protein